MNKCLLLLAYVLLLSFSCGNSSTVPPKDEYYKIDFELNLYGSATIPNDTKDIVVVKINENSKETIYSDNDLLEGPIDVLKDSEVTITVNPREVTDNSYIGGNISSGFNGSGKVYTFIANENKSFSIFVTDNRTEIFNFNIAAGAGGYVNISVYKNGSVVKTYTVDENTSKRIIFAKDEFNSSTVKLNTAKANQDSVFENWTYDSGESEDDVLVLNTSFINKIIKANFTQWIKIYTTSELFDVATNVNTGNDTAIKGKYILMNDMDFRDGNLPSIGNSQYPFKGIMNGNGKTIKNVKINQSVSSSSAGFIGHMENGVVSNLTIDKTATISSGGAIGGIAGYIDEYSIISNCVNNASITSSSISGGIAANSSGMILNSYNTGNIVGSYVGGIAGKNGPGGPISNCYNTGSISITPGGSAGGIAGGLETATIHSSYNTGSITGYTSIGGIVGTFFGDDAVIINCYTTAVPPSSTDLDKKGGIIGNIITSYTGQKVENAYFISDDNTLADNGYPAGNSDTTVRRKSTSDWASIISTYNAITPNKWKAGSGGRPVIAGLGEGK